MDLLVKFYELRSAGAEWGTKQPDPLCVVLGSLGYPVGEVQMELDL